MFIIPTYIYIHKHEETGLVETQWKVGRKWGVGGGESKEAIREVRGTVAFRS